MWKYSVPAVILLLIGLFFYRGLTLNPTVIPSPLIGKPMPEFSLPSLTDPDRLVGSSDLKGQVAVLNVWGTWCIQCRYEHPFLLELARAGVLPIYGLNVEDDRGKAVEWLAALGNPYVFSAFDTNSDVALDWGVYGAPETFLLGRDGTVLHKHIGPLTAADWERDFVPLIKAQCGAEPCPRSAAGWGG